MRAENKAVWEQNHVVYQYRRSLRASVTHTIISEVTFSKEIHFCKSSVYMFLNCRFLQAYVSILYMGLPVHFRIILRGEEVKRRNLVSELKHSQHIRYRCSATEREDEVVCHFFL